MDRGVAILNDDPAGVLFQTDWDDRTANGVEQMWLQNGKDTMRHNLGKRKYFILWKLQNGAEIYFQDCQLVYCQHIKNLLPLNKSLLF